MFENPISGYFTEEERTIERQDLEKQSLIIDDLEGKISDQEVYISNLQNVMLGKLKPEDMEKRENLKPVDISSLDSKTNQR